MNMPIITLLSPDIPQNVGATIRNCVCFKAKLHLIRPFGFFAGEKEIKKVAMDYASSFSPTIFNDEKSYFEDINNVDESKKSRKILFTTKSDEYLENFTFQQNDILLFGSESKGASDYVHANVDKRIKINIDVDARSINLATSMAIALYEYRKQFLLEK